MNWVSKILSYLFSRPHVVERGTDNGWTYTKWSDGYYEATLITEFSGTVAAEGGSFRTTGIAIPPKPNIYSQLADTFYKLSAYTPNVQQRVWASLGITQYTGMSSYTWNGSLLFRFKHEIEGTWK